MLGGGGGGQARDVFRRPDFDINDVMRGEGGVIMKRHLFQNSLVTPP